MKKPRVGSLGRSGRGDDDDLSVTRGRINECRLDF